MSDRLEEALAAIGEWLDDVGTAPASSLSSRDIASVAIHMDLEPAAVAAVAEVESWRWGAFLPGGHPTVLFERHVFHRLTAGRYDAQNPLLSNPSPGGYGKVSDQPNRLREAKKLDSEAAVSSASWGLFQIMGFNFRPAGYASPMEMERDMWRGARRHLFAFAKFIQSRGLDDPLRRHDWHAFARGYNGPAYARHGYHERIAKAYERMQSAWSGIG